MEDNSLISPSRQQEVVCCSSLLRFPQTLFVVLGCPSRIFLSRQKESGLLFFPSLLQLLRARICTYGARHIFHNAPQGYDAILRQLPAFQISKDTQCIQSWPSAVYELPFKHSTTQITHPLNLLVPPPRSNYGQQPAL
jgi:hypothetical protein